MNPSRLRALAVRICGHLTIAYFHLDLPWYARIYPDSSAWERWHPAGELRHKRDACRHPAGAPRMPTHYFLTRIRLDLVGFTWIAPRIVLLHLLLLLISRWWSNFQEIFFIPEYPGISRITPDYPGLSRFKPNAPTGTPKISRNKPE